jgi:hypothetical protein
MVKHRKSVKARIDEELAKLRQRSREAEADLKAISESDWGATSKTALTLRDNDDYLKKAFEAADLDPGNPYHWAELARIPARLRFGSRKAGRRQRWTIDELCQLLRGAYQIEKEHPKWSDRRICEKLVRDHERYAKLSAETLRRRLQDALAQNKYEILEEVFTSREEKEWLERRIKQGRGIKGIASVREIMLLEVIETILSGWHKLERKQGSNSRSRK